MAISFEADGMYRIELDGCEWLLTDSERDRIIEQLDGGRLWWLTCEDDPELLVAQHGSRVKS